MDSKWQIESNKLRTGERILKDEQAGVNLTLNRVTLELRIFWVFAGNHWVQTQVFTVKIKFCGIALINTKYIKHVSHCM